MADPIITGPLAVAGMGLNILGGINQAEGADATARAKAAQLNYQAGVSQVNKKIALQNADYARSVGEVNAERQDMITRAKIGGIKAAKGASGIDVNTGSAVDVVSSAADIGAQETGIIRNNAARAAYGYEVEAVQQEAQTGLYQQGAANERMAGDINVRSSILGTASSVASKWSTASQYGLFSGGGNNLANQGDPFG